MKNVNDPIGNRTRDLVTQCLNQLRHSRNNASSLFYVTTDPRVQGFFSIEASRSHLDTPHSVRLLWRRDRSVAETSAYQRITFTRDRHPCPWRDSNPQSQQASDRRPTPYSARPPGSALISRYEENILCFMLFRCAMRFIGTYCDIKR